MELFGNLLLGFETALSLQTWRYAFLGCLLGTLIGVLPGLGPLATISMLLPFTFGLDPPTALIMLAGIYYGAAYGGSTTAILVNLPGETSSVVTVLDGYQMARQGRAGVALATAADRLVLRRLRRHADPRAFAHAARDGGLQFGAGRVLLADGRSGWSARSR